VVIHDPFKKKVLCDIPTGHTGNIFSVKVRRFEIEFLGILGAEL